MLKIYEIEETETVGSIKPVVENRDGKDNAVGRDSKNNKDSS